MRAWSSFTGGRARTRLSLREVGERLRSRAIQLLPLAVLVTLFVVTDLRGVDFGNHWDEVAWQLEPVREMIRTGLLLPRAAIYPAFIKWLILLPALLQGSLTVFEVGLRPNAIHAAMQQAIADPGYLLLTRRLFICVSALSIVWVYAAALVLRLRVWQATVAAATLALSWEFAYHARYVATDCIVVQFCSLTLLLSFAFLRFGGPRLLYAAAVAAGLAVSTKFPALPLLLVVIACSVWKLPLLQVRAQLTRAVALSATAFAAYLVTTPATVFEPFKFLELAQYISARYAQGHYRYSVAPGGEHVFKVGVYYALSYFSPYRAASVVLALGVPLGAVVWFRKERRVAWILVGFPLLFLAFFCFRYAAFQARNYLLMAPCFGLLLAGGLGALVERLPHAGLRGLVFAALTATGVANGAFLVSAGESVRDADIDREVRRALDYVSARPASRFLLSPRLHAIAATHHFELPPNVVERGGDRVAFIAPAEGPDPFTWPGNDPWAIDQVFGPRDVNVDWYPNWLSGQRIFVMSVAKAREVGVPFVLREEP